MVEGAFVVSVVSLFLVPFTAFVLLKGTIFDVVNLQENPWPLLWYFQLFLVLLPLAIVSALGIDNIPVFFKAQGGIEAEVAFVVISVSIVYIVALSFSLRLFRLRSRRLTLSTAALGKADSLAFALSVLGILVITAFYLLKYKHAFLTALLFDKRLLEVRIANKYSSLVPSQIASIVFPMGYMLAALAGYVGRFNLLRSLGYLAVAFLLLSAPGDKAPPLWGFIIWILAQGSLLRRRLLSWKALVLFAFLLFVGLRLAYFIASLQFPNLNWAKFGDYLLARLGVGQMAGVYETFALMKTHSLPEGEFHLHMIPGASFFVDYVDYQKALMMVTEGYEYTQMGVKNTFFIAEAYAIGGMGLMTLSPIIVAFSTALGLLTLIIFLHRFVGRELSYPIGVMLYLKTHDFTGGFSQFPLFKGLILLVGQLIILWMWYFLFAKFWKAMAIGIKSPQDTLIRKAPNG